MKMSLRTLMVIAVLSISLLLSACGRGSNAPAGSTNAGGNTGPVTFELGSDGEQLAFDKKTLSANAGQQVTIKFTNNSLAQQHNWVLLKSTDSAQSVATEGLTAGLEKGYMPNDMTTILAHIPLVNAKSKGEVSFTAPPTGTYTYICTVPGHYPLMVGTLTVN